MTRFHRDILKLDAPSEVDRIVEWLRQAVLQTLKREGAVLGVSGGVDSAVTLALCARAFGPERTIALLLPERESSPESARLARQVCAQFSTAPLVEDISAALYGFGCYQRRDEAVKAVFAEYDATYKLKITLPAGLLEQETLNVYSATVVSPEGVEQKQRLRPAEFRQIVAASNFKQRARAAMLYYHAEVHNYAVVGTPPKNEQDLGFFVKFGDGAMDVKPLAHLYKSQVYQLAAHLGIPAEIRERPPTSDTYSAGSTQEEFFFRLPFETLDLLWYGWEHEVPSAEVGAELGLEPSQVERAYRDFLRKTRAMDYLRTPPLGCGPDEQGAASAGAGTRHQP